MLVAFILLCIGCIVSLYAPEPNARWIGLVLFVLALLIACVRHVGPVW